MIDLVFFLIFPMKEILAFVIPYIDFTYGHILRIPGRASFLL